MTSLPELISKMYRKQLPLAERKHLTLNLDLRSGNLEVEHPTKLEQLLAAVIDSATSHGHQGGKITIKVTPLHIIIQDDGRALSRQQIANFESEGLSVKSRVGFGTTVTIRLESFLKSTC